MVRRIRWVPVGDFFASGWGRLARLLRWCQRQSRQLQLYWEMPSASYAVSQWKHRYEPMTLYYQIDYTRPTFLKTPLTYAQFRRSNPLPYKKDHIA
jgi:hypothetical protein